MEFTNVFAKNLIALETNCRFIKNEGGSRSSKTYSLCQLLIIYAVENKGKTISIIRKTGPALSATVLRDFEEVLKNMNLYKSIKHNKTDKTYLFPNGSLIEFFSVDDEQKLRGRKRDIAWVNEANELYYDDFQQLNLRTTEKIIVDYNPSDTDSYLYELPKDRTISIHSTYKDNPFLPKAIIDEIESYKNTDEDYYTIFALGKRAYSKENVYQRWEIIDEKPIQFKDFIYAIDYGFNHPTALVKIWYNIEKRELFLEEIIYESYLTSTDIIAKMNLSDVSKSHIIVSETARPEIIADIKRSGYKITEAIKDVKDGIMNLKTFKIYVSSKAKNIIKENENYKYKKINGKITEEVIKLFDDAMDAIRYGAMYIKKYLIKETSNSSKIYNFDF